MPYIKVLVVDHGPGAESVYDTIFSERPSLAWARFTHDPILARDWIVDERPEFIFLNPQIPGVQGFAWMERILQYYQTNIVALLDPQVSLQALCDKAFRHGACHVIVKAKPGDLNDRARFVRELRNFLEIRNSSNGASRTTDARSSLIAVAASTGGTEALKVLLRDLPGDLPPVLIVQHMLRGFTRAFAESLDGIAQMRVKEAAHGERIVAGTAYLAPGDHHMELRAEASGEFSVHLHQEPPLHNVRPAADFLFHSMARLRISSSIGVILTGMGKDGAAGLLAMRRAGSFNFAQDAASSTVFGMPKAAIEMGAIHSVLPLDAMAEALTVKAQRLKSRGKIGA